jgi:hypothetical protein
MHESCSIAPNAKAGVQKHLLPAFFNTSTNCRSGELTSKRRERVAAEGRLAELRAELRRAVSAVSEPLPPATLTLLQQPGRENEAFEAALHMLEQASSRAGRGGCAPAGCTVLSVCTDSMCGFPAPLSVPPLSLSLSLSLFLSLCVCLSLYLSVPSCWICYALLLDVFNCNCNHV